MDDPNPMRQAIVRLLSIRGTAREDIKLMSVTQKSVSSQLWRKYISFC